MKYEVGWFREIVSSSGRPNWIEPPVLLCSTHADMRQHMALEEYRVPDGAICNTCAKLIKAFTIEATDDGEGGVEIGIDMVIDGVFHMHDGSTLELYSDGNIDISDCIHYTDENYTIDESTIDNRCTIFQYLLDGVENRYLIDVDDIAKCARDRYLSFLVRFEYVRCGEDILKVRDWMSLRGEKFCQDIAKSVWNRHHNPSKRERK